MTTELERRLETLAVEVPDPGRVTARVLSSRRRSQGRRWPPVALSVVAALVMMALVAYFAPIASTVVARVPIAGDALGARDRVTLVGDSATSNGYTIALVAAYADAARTELIFHSSPVASLGLGVQMSDQFGRTYIMRSSFSDLVTGDTNVELDPLAWPAPLTGARITVRIAQLHPDGDPTAAPVLGVWVLHATLGVDEATSLALPAPATLGHARLRFTSVVYTPGSLAVDFEITGVSFEDSQLGVSGDPKPKPPFAVDVLDSNGKSIMSSSAERVDWLGVIHVHVLGNRTSDARYSIVATYFADRMERTITLT